MPIPTTKHPTLPVMIDLTTISTPKEQAIVAPVGKVGQNLITQAMEANIRTLPIIDEAGNCAGAISLQKLAQMAASNSALTPADATVPCEIFPHLVPVTKLLQALARHGVVLHAADPDPDNGQGERWFGIVTPADCNRPIFRAHVYQALVILETSLGQLIMDEFGDDWGAIRLLSDHTQARIRDFYDEERAEGVDLSPVTNATLSDLFHIAITSNNVWRLMGFQHPDRLRDVAQQVNNLRNTIMHPVRPFIVNERELHEHAAALQAVDTLTADIVKRIGVQTG